MTVKFSVIFVWLSIELKPCTFTPPLIEAKYLNLPVLAGELDYIRDLIDPIQTFDPNSSISIYRAVKRFLDIPFDRTPILIPKEFVRELFIKDN